MTGNKADMLKKVAIAVWLLLLMAATGLAQEDAVFVSPAGKQIPLSSLRGRVLVLFFSGVQDPQ
ncbi:MAG TPA: hypothetical protein VEZ90_10860, partial [Blastocatellia bacterium]|nr:hypothetical protein [Blastocatellia bacterium]